MFYQLTYHKFIMLIYGNVQCKKSCLTRIPKNKGLSLMIPVDTFVNFSFFSFFVFLKSSCTCRKQNLKLPKNMCSYRRNFVDKIYESIQTEKTNFPFFFVYNTFLNFIICSYTTKCYRIRTIVIFTFSLSALI